MKYYFEALNRFKDFGGRSTRTEYWMFFLINTIIGVGLGLIDMLLGWTGMIGKFGFLGLVYLIYIFLPS